MSTAHIGEGGCHGKYIKTLCENVLTKLKNLFFINLLWKRKDSLRQVKKVPKV